VDQVRGVDSSYTVGLLLDRDLIEECGRLAVPGRPILYRTTPTFLRSFGLSSLEELPELPNASPEDGQLTLEMQTALEQLKSQQEKPESSPTGGEEAGGETMRAWIILGTVLVLLFLLSLVRVGGVLEYSAQGLLVRIRLGRLRLTVFPMRKRARKPRPPQ
jgi:hypothetical protein